MIGQSFTNNEFEFLESSVRHEPLAWEAGDRFEDIHDGLDGDDDEEYEDDDDDEDDLDEDDEEEDEDYDEDDEEPEEDDE